MKEETTGSNSARYSAVATSPTENYESASLELTEATAVEDLAHLYVDRPVKTLNPEYADLAEVHQVSTWTDNFFDEEDDIIAVFDFDYDAMESFYTSRGWVAIAATFLYTPLFMAQLIGLAPCYLQQNVRWSTRSQHVAITRDGIRFVRDRRPCCWGLPCTDQGKSSKTGTFQGLDALVKLTKPTPNTVNTSWSFFLRFLIDSSF